jgi:hypothetical protein
MTEPPLRHWWLVALGKTLRYVIDYADQSTQAQTASVVIVNDPAQPPPTQQKQENENGN